MLKGDSAGVPGSGGCEQPGIRPHWDPCPMGGSPPPPNITPGRGAQLSSPPLVSPEWEPTQDRSSCSNQLFSCKDAPRAPPALPWVCASCSPASTRQSGCPSTLGPSDAVTPLLLLETRGHSCLLFHPHPASSRQNLPAHLATLPGSRHCPGLRVTILASAQSPERPWQEVGPTWPSRSTPSPPCCSFLRDVAPWAHPTAL